MRRFNVVIVLSSACGSVSGDAPQDAQIRQVDGGGGGASVTAVPSRSLRITIEASSGPTQYELRARALTWAVST